MPTRIALLWILLCANSAWAQYKLYEDGVKKYNAKDYYGAVESFSDFLTRQTRDRKFDADAYYWRGMAAYMLKDYTVASEDFRQSISLNHPKRGNAYWLIAKCNDIQNLNTEAINNYTAALNLLKDSKSQAEILIGRSDVYAKLGNTEAAINDAQQALALQPERVDFKLRLESLTKPLQRVTQLSTSAPSNNSASIESGKKEKPVEKVPETSITESSSNPKTNPESKDKPSVKEEPLNTRTISSNPPVTQQVVSVAVPVAKEPTLEDIYKDEKRYALVIGNSNYTKEIGVLKNPVNDATDFAETLKTMNFEVTLVTDASYGKIRVEMMKFRDKLNEGERDKTVGLFYYAGHGLQYEGENYIVPVDAEIQFEDDIPRFCFPIQKMVLNQMELTNSRMNIVILDACRNNPFPVIHRSIGESSGLGEMKKARGAFIAYSTSPGSVASDGTGRNGLYTQELIKAMNKPNFTIEQVFKEVRANVLRQSGEKQNPWENSNIIGDFYFKLK